MRPFDRINLLLTHIILAAFALAFSLVAYPADIAWLGGAVLVTLLLRRAGGAWQRFSTAGLACALVWLSGLALLAPQRIAALPISLPDWLSYTVLLSAGLLAFLSLVGNPLSGLFANWKPETRWTWWGTLLVLLVIILMNQILAQQPHISPLLLISLAVLTFPGLARNERFLQSKLFPVLLVIALVLAGGRILWWLSGPSTTPDNQVQVLKTTELFIPFHVENKVNLAAAQARNVQFAESLDTLKRTAALGESNWRLDAARSALSLLQGDYYSARLAQDICLHMDRHGTIERWGEITTLFGIDKADQELLTTASQQNWQDALKCVQNISATTSSLFPKKQILTAKYALLAQDKEKFRTSIADALSSTDILTFETALLAGGGEPQHIVPISWQEMKREGGVTTKQGWNLSAQGAEIDVTVDNNTQIWVEACSSDAAGFWGLLDVYCDDLLVEEIYIEGNQLWFYPLSNLPAGEHILSLRFANDFLGKDGTDRNLFINSVWIKK